MVYNDAGGYVELLAANNSTVPEPSSLLLLGSGLANHRLWCAPSLDG